ncbi:hypothetical protein N9873_04395, partial [Akkermansiaceae bacterium]|nr:hypothetical protein [Akkermansiaceae bacterium]
SEEGKRLFSEVAISGTGGWVESKREGRGTFALVTFEGGKVQEGRERAQRQMRVSRRIEFRFPRAVRGG